MCCDVDIRKDLHAKMVLSGHVSELWVTKLLGANIVRPMKWRTSRASVVYYSEVNHSLEKLDAQHFCKQCKTPGMIRLKKTRHRMKRYEQQAALVDTADIALEFCTG